MFGKVKQNTYRAGPIHRRRPPLMEEKPVYPLEAATAPSRKVSFHHHLLEPL
jgi:hypothetical protein